MYEELFYTSRLKKDLKKFRSEIDLIGDFLKLLQQSGVEGIPANMRPHKLIGDYSKNWECHLKPDLLVIWLQFENPKKIILVRIGSHSDLF
jgi:mRNA interferase YafQ